MKTLKSLTLFTVLLILSACSTSGNNGGTGGNGDGGGTQTIFDKLIGTWDGSKQNAGFIIFTKQDVTIAAYTYKGIPQEILKLKDGREWALYYDKAKVPSHAIFYINGNNLYWMTGSKEYIQDATKEFLDKVIQNPLATKQP